MIDEWGERGKEIFPPRGKTEIEKRGWGGDDHLKTKVTLNHAYSSTY